MSVVAIWSRKASGHSAETAGDELEEGVDDVKSVRSLCLGLHTCYNGAYRGVCQPVRGSKSQKARPSSDWRLQFASMKSESLVTADQLRCREYVPGPCTHRPSSDGSRGYPKEVA